MICGWKENVRSMDINLNKKRERALTLQLFNNGTWQGSKTSRWILGFPRTSIRTTSCSITPLPWGCTKREKSRQKTKEKGKTWCALYKAVEREVQNWKKKKTEVRRGYRAWLAAERKDKMKKTEGARIFTLCWALSPNSALFQFFHPWE